MKPCFQFRLRTLMIVVTLLAVPLGYVGWQAKIVRERKDWFNATRHASQLTMMCSFTRRLGLSIATAILTSTHSHVCASG